MEFYNLILERLRIFFKISLKKAEKIFLDLISDQSKMHELDDIIQTIKNNFIICQTCFSIVKNKNCSSCLQKNSDELCVVESVYTQIKIEKLNIFSGKFHILQGLIDINNKIFPEDLTIKQLEKRLKNEQIKKVVLCLPATYEGEVTLEYLKKIIYNYKEIEVFQIAKGIPFGGSLDYIDNTTLKIALNNKKKII